MLNYTAYYKIPPEKRIFDIVFSLLAIIALSPVLLTVALLIRISSKGPIVYKSKRVGSNYKVFDFLKFRSMYSDADQKLLALAKTNNQYSKGDELTILTPLSEDELKNGAENQTLLYSDDMVVDQEMYTRYKREQNGTAFNKISNDPRITPIGNFIRNTSIDELPQLFNVLKGDMSIVGNRPLPVYEAEKLTTDDQSLRFFAPAGITGLWQVSKRGKKDMSPEERMELDNFYAKNCSLWFDIKILLRTLPALLQKDNV